jgi:hypothetical protein
MWLKTRLADANATSALQHKMHSVRVTGFISQQSHGRHTCIPKCTGFPAHALDVYISDTAATSQNAIYKLERQLKGPYQTAPVGEDDGVLPYLHGCPARPLVVGEKPHVIRATPPVWQVGLEPPLSLQRHGRHVFHSLIYANNRNDVGLRGG